MQNILTRLQASPFRRSFRLREKERDYLVRKGRDQIKREAYEFICTRIAPAHPQNDGRQTPMKNHPVFIAQHATATCCRKCLQKWHKIKQEKELDTNEIDHIVTIIMAWLHQEVTH
ncbi:DUF4186 domain-containing protein [Candidatus Omnitrophota bacterium]